MARADRTLHGHVPYPTADASDEDKARWTQHRWHSQDPLYEPFYRKWSEIIAFIRGRHWDIWSQHSMRMVPETDVPPWRERMTVNYTFAIWKTFIAKLTKNRPAWDVRPASGDAEDINAALLGRSILEWLWTAEMNLSEMWRRVVAWVVTTGNCWVETFWDENTGEVVELTTSTMIAEIDPNGNPTGNFLEAPAAMNPETGEPVVDPETGLPLDVEPVTEDMGQVGIAVHTPFSVRTNPEAFSDPEAVTDVMIGVPVTREWVERTYNADMAASLNYDSGDATSIAIEQLETIATGGHERNALFETSTPTTRESKGETTLIIRHYHKPDREYPNGRFWVAAGNGQMIEPETSLPLGIWPLVHAQAYPNPGLLLSMSPIEPIIPLNRRLNEQNSRIAEYEKLMMNGKWLVPKTANIRKGAITTEPGEVITYTPPFEPKLATIKALPAAVYSEREGTKQDIQFVSGIHKISLGQPPPGVTAGRAFLVLQEADDTDLGPILTALSESLSKLGHLVLWTIRQNYTEPRTVAIVGKNTGEFLYRDFVGEDLDPGRSGSLSIQVKVQEGSMFPWLKAAAQEMALQLLQTPVGQMLLQSPDGQLDRNRLSDILQVGGLESLVDTTDLDTAEAERTYDDLAQHDGRSPLPSPHEWQNLAVHVSTFERHLKSKAFTSLPPPNQRLVLAYYKQLTMVLSQQQQMAIQSQLDQLTRSTEAEEFGRKMGEIRAMAIAEREDIDMPGTEGSSKDPKGSK
ncbi:MAG: hypothetical protein AMS18_00475 [Gemmatimonas sp. SG8_17]|nr:MAG: hypothetical protein AMS18_00475 [Gemmatimonas sp. SG8_17]